MEKNSLKTSEKSVPQPISFYGLSKLNGEKILLNLKNNNINVKIFRIFNAYGIFRIIIILIKECYLFIFLKYKETHWLKLRDH